MDKKKIAIIALVLVAAGAWIFKNKGDESKPLVRTAKIEKGNFNDKITLEGTVVPEEESVVFAQVPIVVDRVDLKGGSRVTEGDVILTFTGEAKAEIEKALEEINIQVNTAEALVDTLRRQAKNAEFEAQVTQQQFRVNKELLAQDAISSIEVSKSQTLANQAKSNLEDLKSRVLVENQKYTLLKTRQEDLEKKFQFVSGDLKAPISGIITELPVENGSILREGQKMVALAKEGNYKIKMEAPANLIGNIKEGSLTKIRDISNNSEYSGKVTKVSRVARDDEKKQKVIDVEVALDGGEGLNPGFLTAVEITGGIPTDAKLADAFSVLEEEGKTFVYMVKDGAVEKVPVQVGVRTSSKYEIVDLPEGTEIIVNPSKVKPGEKVRVGGN